MSGLPCPSAEELQAYNEGLVATSLMQEIESHLEGCDACIQFLDALPPGQLAEGIRMSFELDQEELESLALTTGILDADSDHHVAWKTFAPSRHASLGIDRYELIGEIGAGAMGKTFLAVDDSKQPFAVKIPHPGQMTSDGSLMLFLQDAGLASPLVDQYIVPVADYGHWQDDLPYIAYQHVASPSLKRFSRIAFLADERTLALLFSQLCLAIETAHRQNLLHRHLTPNNIFIAPGPTLLVSEFCVHYDGRYQFELLQPLTDPNPFMSPEAANNDPEFIDQRNDIYAMGKILKLLLKITPELPPDRRATWEMIQTKCTRPRRRDRFQTVREIMQLVSQVQVS